MDHQQTFIANIGNVTANVNIGWRNKYALFSDFDIFHNNYNLPLKLIAHFNKFCKNILKNSTSFPSQCTSKQSLRKKR